MELGREAKGDLKGGNGTRKGGKRRPKRRQKET